MEFDLELEKAKTPAERFKELRHNVQILNHDHSYAVRRLFLAAAILMITLLPHLNTDIPYPAFISLFAIIAIVIAAGMTNFMRSLTIAIDTALSFVATIIFEYYAVTAHSMMNQDLFFLANQALAIIFLFAFYESVKTLRALWLLHVKHKQSATYFS
jgi:hypothetical protein